MRAASGAKFPYALGEVKEMLTRRSLAPLLVDPKAGDGRRAIADRAAQDAAGHVSQVWLEEHEVRAVRHPHSKDLVVLPVHDPPGRCALLRPVGRLPEL